MTDTIVRRLLWTIGILGTAALLATVSTQFVSLPWIFHFGSNLLALSAISSLAWRISRARAEQETCAASVRTPEGEPQAALLAEAGHEMKTPLAGIKAYVELLADGTADDEAVRVEFLDGIVSQVERLEHAIERLFTTPRG